MYLPTKEELEEMCFQEIATGTNGFIIGKFYIGKPMQLPYIEFNSGYGRWFIFQRGDTLNISPQSKQDIETLIRLLTHNE